MPNQDDAYVIDEPEMYASLRRKQKGQEPTRQSAEARRTPLPRPAAAPSPRITISRSPVASSLSMFVCGAGQMVNGQGKLGLLLFLTEVLALAAHWSALKLGPALKDLAALFSISEWNLFVGFAVTDLFFVLLILYNVAQAYTAADREGIAFDGIRAPVVPAIASLVLPGWGQILNAQIGKALGFFGCVLAEAYVAGMLLFTPVLRLLEERHIADIGGEASPVIWLGLIGSALLTWVLSAYDALLVSGFRRRGI